MVLWTLVGLSFVITPFGALALFLLRLWMQGPTKGSDNPKKLNGKTVVITGKYRKQEFMKAVSNMFMFNYPRCQYWYWKNHSHRLGQERGQSYHLLPRQDKS